MTDRLSDQDQVTLDVLAIIEQTTAAEQRRQAVRSYLSNARQDPNIAEIVRLVMASRHKKLGGNVIQIGGRR